MEIKKEKNFIRFILEENKEYVIDINTAEVIGLRGKTLANMPKAVISALEEVEYGTTNIYALIPLIMKVKSYGNISMGTLEDLQPIMGLLDALQSVGFVPTDTRTEGVNGLHITLVI